MGLRHLIIGVVVAALVFSPAVLAGGGIVGSAGPSESAVVRGSSLQQGTNIFSGDVVEVGPGGEGVVTFGHNAMARFAELSAVRASRDANTIGLELIRGRMVYRTTPEQPVVGIFADALVRSETGAEAVAIVAFRSPSLVVITAERGALAVTAGRDKRTVAMSQGQMLEVALSETLPADGQAPPSQAQSAGQMSRQIPNVTLQRGTIAQFASPGSKIVWGDLLTTDQAGRARISLDDGSILNVGSNSQLRVVQHDAANQQTRVQLAYGKLRANVVRLARAVSNFEIHTSTAVAGVVGTDLFLAAIGDMTILHVFEGTVNFCNLAGQCVTVTAGNSSTVRGGEPPTPPAPTPATVAAESIESTSLGSETNGAAGAAVAAGASHSGAITLITGTVLGGTALGVGLALSSSQPKLTCTQKGSLVSPFAFPCQ